MEGSRSTHTHGHDLSNFLYSKETIFTVEVPLSLCNHVLTSVPCHFFFLFVFLLVGSLVQGIWERPGFPLERGALHLVTAFPSFLSLWQVGGSLCVYVFHKQTVMQALRQRQKCQLWLRMLAAKEKQPLCLQERC